MTQIVSFMLGETPDKFGRYIDKFLAYSHFWLEHDHKYIQLLFPIDEGTKFNNHAPLVTEHDKVEFVKNEVLRSIHLKSLDLMLDFWGLKRNEEKILSQLPFNPKNHVWLKTHDHNQLRITRVIRSLTLLGNEKIAKNLSTFLVKEAKKIGTVPEKVINYWQEALSV